MEQLDDTYELHSTLGPGGETLPLPGDTQYYSPQRQRLRGTLLGNYLDTRSGRYLAAFILYCVAFALAVVAGVRVANAIGAPDRLGAMREVMPTSFLLIVFGAYATTFANVFARRLHLAISFGLLAAGGTILVRIT